MRATGNFESARNVDPMVVLSDKTRAHIDHWLGKFPPDRKRSAVLQGLHAAQEQNDGWLTDELIAGVAKYLDLPPVWAYEVATFYSMFETQQVGRNHQIIGVIFDHENIGVGRVFHHYSFPVPTGALLGTAGPSKARTLPSS